MIALSRKEEFDDKLVGSATVILPLANVFRACKHLLAKGLTLGKMKSSKANDFRQNRITFTTNSCYVESEANKIVLHR